MKMREQYHAKKTVMPRLHNEVAHPGNNRIPWLCAVMDCWPQSVCSELSEMSCVIVWKQLLCAVTLRRVHIVVHTERLCRQSSGHC